MYRVWAVLVCVAMFLAGASIERGTQPQFREYSSIGLRVGGFLVDSACSTSGFAGSNCVTLVGPVRVNSFTPRRVLSCARVFKECLDGVVV